MNLADARVLTIAQPWSAAIACPDPNLAKTVENRTWSTEWRGPLFVHAGKRWSHRGAHDPRVRRLIDAGLVRPAVTGIVALAELVDVHADRGCCRPWGESLRCDRCSRVQRLPAALVDPADGLGEGDACRCIDLPPPPCERKRRRPETVYHWVMADVVPLAEPVPYVGHQGLRAARPDVLDAVAAALPESVPA